MKTHFDYEIIVGDDASTDEATVTRNEVIEFLPNLRIRQNGNQRRTSSSEKLANRLFTF